MGRMRKERRRLRVINSPTPPDPAPNPAPPFVVVVKSPYCERRVCVTAQNAMDVAESYAKALEWSPDTVSELNKLYALAYPTFWIRSGGLDVVTPFYATEDFPEDVTPARDTDFKRMLDQIQNMPDLWERHQLVLAGLMAREGDSLACHNIAWLEKWEARKHVAKKLRKTLEAQMREDLRAKKKALKDLVKDLNNLT